MTAIQLVRHCGLFHPLLTMLKQTTLSTQVAHITVPCAVDVLVDHVCFRD